MNKKLICLFLALFCAAGHAVPVKFLAWDDTISQVKFDVIKAEKANPIVNLHSLRRSDKIDISEAVCKVRAAGVVTPEGNPIDFEVNIAGKNNPLIILMPSPKTPAKYTGFAVEDAEAGFKWGSILVINATKEDLVMVVDKTPTPVGKWQPTIVMPKKLGSGVGIEFRKKGANLKDSASVMWSMVWQAEAEIRRLVIVLPSTDPRNGDLEIKSIEEDRRIVTAAAREGANDNNNGPAQTPR